MKRLQKFKFYPWLCWGLATTLYLAQDSALVLPVVFKARLMDALALNDVQLSLLSAAFLYTYVLMQIPAGLLYDRFGARKVLTYVAITLAIGCFIFASSTGFWMALFGRLIMGLAGGFTFLGAITLANQWFSERQFPIIIGLTEIFYGSVGILTAIAAKYESELSVFSLILFIGSLCLLVGFVIQAIVRNKSKVSIEKSKISMGAVSNLFRDKKLWLLGLYAGFTFAPIAVYFNLWGITYTEAIYHLSILEATEVESLSIIGFMIGIGVISFLTKYIAAHKLMLIAAVANVVFFLCLNYVDLGVIFNASMQLICGILIAPIILSFQLVKTFTGKEHYSVSSGFINMFIGGIGVLVLPLVGLLMQDFSKNILVSTIPITILIILAPVVLYSLFRQLGIKFNNRL